MCPLVAMSSYPICYNVKTFYVVLLKLALPLIMPSSICLCFIEEFLVASWDSGSSSCGVHHEMISNQGVQKKFCAENHLISCLVKNLRYENLKLSKFAKFIAPLQLFLRMKCKRAKLRSASSNFWKKSVCSCTQWYSSSVSGAREL